MASDTASTILVPPARTAGALTFGALFALESFARAINSTVVSLQAYDLLHSAQRVSVLSTCVSASVLFASLALPLLIGRVPRRWAYTLGVGAIILASICLATFTLLGQAGGMFLRNLGASLLSITLSLYILDHVKKHDLAKVEPLRLSLSTASWAAGPFTGVWLYANYGPWAAQALAILACGALLALFWTIRLGDHAIIRPGPTRQTNPLANVGRFIAQPRLRLAWLIAFGRSCFWVTLFIYGPLLMVEGGLGKIAGGWLISLSQAVLATAYLFGRLALRIGVRKVIAGALASGGLMALGAGLAGTDLPLAATACLLLGSVAASALDGVGGIPFLRAVRHRERAEMTAVYRTYIDLSELLPSFVFALALIVLPIGIVFAILGVVLAAIGLVAWRHLPRSM
jgi:MFS family permease